MDTKTTTERRAAWIRKHGSTRLKKALDLGLLGSSLTLYREERLALERPDWIFATQHDRLEEIRNPSEEALDVLLDVRQVFPTAELVSVVSTYGETSQRREAVSVAAPFGDEDPCPRPALRIVGRR